MHIAASAAPVLSIPPPTPTQAYGTHCPPMAAPRPASSVGSESALAAPPRQCPAPGRFRVLCPITSSVHSPLRTSDSALCSQRVACRKNHVLPGSGPTDLHFGKNGIVKSDSDHSDRHRR